MFSAEREVPAGGQGGPRVFRDANVKYSQRVSLPQRYDLQSPDEGQGRTREMERSERLVRNMKTVTLLSLLA